MSHPFSQYELPDFSSQQIIVFGDLMLDRYWYGDVNRISPEAPVPVVKVNRYELRPGGAANVALNLASLGAQVILFGFVGVDVEGEQLQKLLESSGIVCCFSRVPDYQTITKLRLIGHNQQLIRMDFEKQFHEVSSDELITQYQAYLNTANAVILSDYAKGSLNQVQRLITLAKSAKKPVFVDPKNDEVTYYRGATFIKPNRKEFEMMVGPCADHDVIVERARDIINANHVDGLLVTLGSDGMLLVEYDKEPYFLPTQAHQIYDVTGAGDTVIAVFALVFAATKNTHYAVFLANIAAGIVVGKLGSATASIDELQQALQNNSNSKTQHILSEAELIHAVKKAQSEGEVIVMTNGCFDILHSGHVHYLNQAKALGDRLIVAVNDDASVKQLKGSTRPFNSLDERMLILSGLRAVDWVVSFSEDTPERLITAVLPDVLVKGGDYQVEQVAGHQAVLAHGGTVKILDFVDGKSTTQLVDKIQERRS